MAMAYRKSLRDPDEHLDIARCSEDLVEIGDFTVGRVVSPPGWRWARDMAPLVGGRWCQARHVGIVLSGRMEVRLEDGTLIELGPDDVFDIPPGHDAEVVGDEPCVELDWAGLETWTGHRVRFHDRVLAGLLMIDIVGSTAHVAQMGDAQWRSRLGEFYETVRRQVDRFKGREIDTAGDGMFVVFDGAARALECAVAVRAAAEDAGTPVRAGVHVGEVEVTAAGVRGLAVHEVARIAALGGPGDILLSETARALGEAARFRFVDRGSHHLKGLDGERKVYGVAPDSSLKPGPEEGLGSAGW